MAKQSFRISRDGHAYQRQSVVEWERTVGFIAHQFWMDDPVKCPIVVILDFYLLFNKADIDNLAKAVLDGMQGIVYANDRQVWSLRLTKSISKKPGVRIRIMDHGNI